MKSLIFSLAALCSFTVGVAWAPDATACSDGHDACHKKCHDEETKCVEHCHDDACKHKCEEAEKACKKHCK